jgi:hypothetical protein
MHNASATGSSGGTRPPDPLPYSPQLLVLPLQLVYLLVQALDLEFSSHHILIVSGTIDIVTPLLPSMVGSLSTTSARIAGLSSDRANPHHVRQLVLVGMAASV